MISLPFTTTFPPAPDAVGKEYVYPEKISVSSPWYHFPASSGGMASPSGQPGVGETMLGETAGVGARCSGRRAGAEGKAHAQRSGRPSHVHLPWARQSRRSTRHDETVMSRGR